MITGMSGSGKHTLLKSFEDFGYFCVDNLPVQLIPYLVRVAETQGTNLARLAVVVDVREGPFLEGFMELHKSLLKSWFRTHLIFLEASDRILVKRFSETRRPHPLAVDKPILQGIRRERRMLRSIKKLADTVLDTSEWTVHALRRFVSDQLHSSVQKRSMVTSIVSFGFKYGIPVNSDLMFDVRFLPNPFFIKRLHRKTGNDPAVIKYLFRFKESQEIAQRIAELMCYLHPFYWKEGKSYLTVSIGCTGGRHRSVAIANAVSKILQDKGVEITTVHRDVNKADSEEV